MAKKKKRQIKKAEDLPKKLEVEPLGDRLIVRRLHESETSAGGIILPQTAREIKQEVEAVHVGPGRLMDSGEYLPIPIEPGDRLLLAKYGGADIKVDGEDLLIIERNEALAKIS